MRRWAGWVLLSFPVEAHMRCCRKLRPMRDAGACSGSCMALHLQPVLQHVSHGRRDACRKSWHFKYGDQLNCNGLRCVTVSCGATGTGCTLRSSRKSVRCSGCSKRRKRSGPRGRQLCHGVTQAVRGGVGRMRTRTRAARPTAGATTCRATTTTRRRLGAAQPRVTVGATEDSWLCV